MAVRNDSGRRVRFTVGDGEMAGVAFGAENRPPEILFLHATGLNALAYRELLEPLGEHFHVVAIDLRGHGRTTLARRTLAYSSWNRHRDDVIELISKHFPAAVTLAGHSMGGTVSLLVAGKRADLVRGACLIDPVILPPGRMAPFYAPGFPAAMTLFSPLSSRALRRRGLFQSKEEFVQAITGRGFFKTWSDEAINDYAEDALFETPKGMRLACRPVYEARTFAAHAHDPWRAFERAPGPIVILRAETGSTTPDAVAQRIAARRPDLRIGVVEGATHALPMEKPDRVRAAIESAALMGGGKERYIDLE